MKKTFPYEALAGIGVLVGAMSGTTGLAQETRGFKVGHLTVSPYVNLEANFNSNVDLNRYEQSDWFLTVNPGADLTYQGNDWGLNGSVWYSYDKYQKFEELDEPRYGERLQGFWESPKGFRLLLGESYLKSKSSDSILDGGNGIWRERDYTDLNGAFAYQMSEKTEVTLSGQYSELNYSNSGQKYGYLYGWQEWSVGLELARKLSEKSNLLLAGTYQEYEQDNVNVRGDRSPYDNASTGYSLMGGLGSRATERITYRALTGVSWFDYGGEGNVAGWTYSLDGNWVINRKWAASVAGSSYFQPSETEVNQSMQAYTLSVGLTYRPITKLTIRGDIGYRREEDQYRRLNYENVDGYETKMTDNIYSLRLRADYQFAKYASVYAGIEYTDWESDESKKKYSDSTQHEYDRVFGTLGLRLRY